MRQELRRFAATLTGAAALPPLLDAAVARLEASPWPEVATRWSRLTPGGCPVEFTVRDGGPRLRWAAEVTGPEVAEDRRLGLAAGILAEAGQPLPARLDGPLRDLQRGAAGGGLRFGAWLGGREGAGEPPRLKLYAELPDGLDPDLLRRLLPDPVAAALPRLPRGTLPRMLGVEPARGSAAGGARIELYLRLPGTDPHDLLPVLHGLGHEAAIPLLDRALPDGLRRLAGRRLGLSVAAPSGDGGEGPVELALFASARSLFPVDPMMAAGLVPSAGGLDPGRVRWGLVTLGLDPAGRRVPAALGVPGLPHWRTAARGPDGPVA